MAYPSHLKFFSDDNPGYTRKKRGRGFQFLDSDLKPIAKGGTLERIKSLVIPPAWDQVWISPLKNGHLQCTGKDLKCRKQYLYHPDWVAYRQAEKFSRLLEFGRFLPKIRKTYSEDMKGKEWEMTRVLALVVSLLDNYYFRVGNKQYADQNDTYGLTTLRRKHIDDLGRGLALSYKAKSGKHRRITIKNRTTARLIREISELPGYEIFRYKCGSREYRNVDSGNVNHYLELITGEGYTAKDFRTWGGTKLAIEYYDHAMAKLAENPKLKFDTTLVKLVAKTMNNTVSVCREYYIHPDVLKYLSSQYPNRLKLPRASRSEFGLSREEKLIIKILN